MNNSELVDAVVELAKEMDLTDPIDFGVLQISEETAHRMIAASVIENTFKDNPNTEELKLMLLATVTHLVVENFVDQKPTQDTQLNYERTHVQSFQYKVLMLIHCLLSS